MTEVKKKLREMTKEEYASYRHTVYMKHRTDRLAKQHNYYVKNQDRIKQREKDRYNRKKAENEN